MDEWYQYDMECVLKGVRMQIRISRFLLSTAVCDVQTEHDNYS